MRADEVRIVAMVAVTKDGGRLISEGDTITTADARGDRARFVHASRPTVPGKSGKVVVQWLEGDRANGTRCEYYAHIFGLRVDALLSCGCPLNVVNDEGHQEGCTVVED
jgi:hypothetical protein